MAEACFNGKSSGVRVRRRGSTPSPAIKWLNNIWKSHSSSTIQWEDWTKLPQRPIPAPAVCDSNHSTRCVLSSRVLTFYRLPWALVFGGPDDSGQLGPWSRWWRMSGKRSGHLRIYSSGQKIYAREVHSFFCNYIASLGLEWLHCNSSNTFPMTLSVVDSSALDSSLSR